MVKLSLSLLFLATLSLAAYLSFAPSLFTTPEKPARIEWYIPDGLRADPELFPIFQWAEEGKLPHLWKLMQRGAYGYSVPVFPGHSAVNFATLLTGSFPTAHGISDTVIRDHEGSFLAPTKLGFSSFSRLLTPAWLTLETAGWKDVVVSVPGSTPPESPHSWIIKGRWGGWGDELESFLLESDSASLHSPQIPPYLRRNREFAKPFSPMNWATLPKSYSPVRELKVEAQGLKFSLLLVDSSDDGEENYDHIAISEKKSAGFTLVPLSNWSPWISTNRNSGALKSVTRIKLYPIELGKKNHARIRVLIDGLNPSLSQPSWLADDLLENVGPMVDYADHQPPVLIGRPGDKAVFLHEMRDSFSWHARAAEHLHRKIPEKKVFYLHSNYSPNQMLSSRWWMAHLDPKSRKYDQISEQKREELRAEVLQMYQEVDKELGRAMERVGENGWIVFSSDHGMAPLNYELRINSLLARNGLLHCKSLPDGTTTIDWKKSRAVFSSSNHIYLNPEGLSSSLRDSSSPAMTALKKEVKDLLQKLNHPGIGRPIEEILEVKGDVKNLPAKNLGDFLLTARTGYLFVEDCDKTLPLFKEAVVSGAKHSIDPARENALWTPFLIAGPGIKKNFMFPNPIRHVDQLPTLLKAAGVKNPQKTDGVPLNSAFTSESATAPR